MLTCWAMHCTHSSSSEGGVRRPSAWRTAGVRGETRGRTGGGAETAGGERGAEAMLSAAEATRLHAPPIKIWVRRRSTEPGK